jgi:hypothetical protein
MGIRGAAVIAAAPGDSNTQRCAVDASELLDGDTRSAGTT